MLPDPAYRLVPSRLLHQSGEGQPFIERAFAWPTTERSLIEFRPHSLKASTIANLSLPVVGEMSRSSGSDRNSTPVRCRPSITYSPQVRPVSEGAKVDRVGERLLTAIIWLLNPDSHPQR